MTAYRPFLLVWLVLLALLATTVAASFVLTGASSVTIGLGIAVAKAGLVYWFFMRLSDQRGLIRLAAGAGVSWLLILLSLSLADYLTR